MLESDDLVEKDRVIAFIVEMMAKYNVNLKKVAAAGDFQSEESAAIAARLTRDWSDGKGNDPGFAVRQQYLNPPPSPWDDIE